MSRFKLLLGLVVIGLVVTHIPSYALSGIKSTFLIVVKPMMLLVHNSTEGISSAFGAKSPSKAEDSDPIHSPVDSSELEELRLENERLRKLLKFGERKKNQYRKTIAAEVIGRPAGGWRDTVILNKGSRQGLKRDMPVLAEGGLIGKIVEVEPFTSKVKLLTHPRIRVGSLVQRTRHIGVVYGSLDGGCRMKYLSMDADVEPGDKITTAPFSQGFPKGLMIGVVDQVWKEAGQLYKVASIKLSADIQKLEEVLCVEPS